MANTDAITDFNQFTALRAQARQNDAGAVRKVAQQFEALFTQQLLKGMRSTSLASDVMGGGQTEFYQDIFDQQMAVHMSSGKGMGLADMLVRQLRGKQAPDPASASTDGSSAAAGAHKALPLRSSAGPMALPASKTAASATAAYPAATAGGDPGADASLSTQHLRAVMQGWLRASQSVGGAGAVDGTAAPGTDTGTSPLAADASADNSPQAFAAAILPHAQRAARELGVPVQMLMAQAALETGWGQHSVQQASGKPGFNFFGIKADSSWQGASVQSMTSEYRQGSSSNETAQFRAYDSPSAAFDDYVKLLKNNPRYADAVRSGGDAVGFAVGLQNAGYATDPAYAQKLLKVAYGPTMRSVLASATQAYSA